MVDSSSLSDCLAKGDSFTDAAAFCSRNQIPPGNTLYVVYQSFTNGNPNSTNPKLMGTCVKNSDGVITGITDPGMKGFLTQASDGNYDSSNSQGGKACSLWVSRTSPAKSPQKVRDAYSESALSSADDCVKALGLKDASTLQSNSDSICQGLQNGILTSLVNGNESGVITLNLSYRFDGSATYNSIGTCNLDLKARKDDLANLTYQTVGTVGANGLNYGSACVLKVAAEDNSGGVSFTAPIFNQILGSDQECKNFIKGKLDCKSLWSRPEISVIASKKLLWPSLTFNGNRVDLQGSDFGGTASSKSLLAIANSDHKACGVPSQMIDTSCTLASVLTSTNGTPNFIGNIYINDQGLTYSGFAPGDQSVSSSSDKSGVKNCYASFRNRFGLNPDGSYKSGVSSLDELSCVQLLAATKLSVDSYDTALHNFHGTKQSPPFGDVFDPKNPKSSVFLDPHVGCQGAFCDGAKQVCHDEPLYTQCQSYNGVDWNDPACPDIGQFQTGTDQICTDDPSYYTPYLDASGVDGLTKTQHACGYTFIKTNPGNPSDSYWTLMTLNQAKEITRIRNATTGTPMVNCDPTLTPFGGGDGSPSAPFLICSVKQFQAITGKTITVSGTTLNGVTTPDYSGLPSYQLTQDLDFTGQAFTPIPSFTGNFNGNGKNLKGISFQEGSAKLTQSLGVFRQTKDAVIANLVLESISIQGGDRVGALVGQAVSTRFLNISTKDQICGLDGNDCAAVTAKSAGGISVTGKAMVGGLVGESLGGSSFDTIKIKAMVKDTGDGTLVGYGSDKTTGKTDTGVGGLVGIIHNLPSPTVPVMSVFKTISVRAQVLWSNAAVDVPNWTFTGGVLGYGPGIQMTDVKFSGLVTGVSFTGGIAGDLDTIPSGPNNLNGVSVEAQADNGVLSSVKGVSSVGGIYGGGYGIVVSDSFSSANVLATGTNIGGISGAGCGNTIQRVAMFGSVVGKSGVAGIDGLSCVLSLKDVIAVGSVRGPAGAEAGISAGGYQPTTLTNVVSMVKIMDTSAARATIAGPIGNYDSKGIYGGVAANQFTVTNAYYQKSLNPDLTDPLQIWLTVGSGPKAVPQSQGYVAKSLLDSEISGSGKYTGFDFSKVWVMPKSVPVSLNGGKVFPVLRSSCGKAGVVCP